MNQKLRMLMLLTLVALTLTSCACSNGMNAAPSPSPSAMTASPIPSPVETPMESMMPTESAPTAENEPSASPEGSGAPEMMGMIDTESLITELEKLSEVDTAEVVAMDDRAIVGLNFDAQYQGTLTERIEEMVVKAVTGVEAMLTKVAVTADPTLVTEIRTLAAESNGKELSEEQKTQFDELYRKIKPAETEDSGNTAGTTAE